MSEYKTLPDGTKPLVIPAKWMGGSSDDPPEKPSKSSDKSSDKPSDKPLKKPSDKPSKKPSDKPSNKPSNKPSKKPSDKPSDKSSKGTPSNKPPKDSLHPDKPPNPFRPSSDGFAPDSCPKCYHLFPEADPPPSLPEGKTEDGITAPDSILGGTKKDRKRLFDELFSKKMIPTNPKPYKSLSPGPWQKVRCSYYGPDIAHGVKGGNDNLFFNVGPNKDQGIGAGQYNDEQLRQIGKHFCAMPTFPYLANEYMGKVLRVCGKKSCMDFVVVDRLPDRVGGVYLDVHNMLDWLALGGEADKGIQEIKFRLVGEAALPVGPWSPYNKINIKYNLGG